MKLTDRTSRNHHLNWWKEKKYTRSKPSSIIKKEDAVTNITSNGKVIQSPTPHGNRSMCSPMMETP